jgi:hypothetical protein
MEQPLAQIQVTISEKGVVGIAVEGNNEFETKNGYKFLNYVAEDLHLLDDSICAKDLERRLREMREFVGREQKAKAELELSRFLVSRVEVADA